jgi:hypothetical protein
MARISIHLDSATAEEAAAFLAAFQRTSEMGLPANPVDLPTVKLVGIGWHINTPAMRPDRAMAMNRLLEASTEA